MPRVPRTERMVSANGPEPQCGLGAPCRLAYAPKMMRLLTLLACLLVSMLTSRALAQDTNTSDEAELDAAARVLFNRGTDAYEVGNFEDALSHFERAYELSQRDLLLYNIAISHDRLNHQEQAADYYERFVTALPDAGNAPVARSRAEILRRDLAARAQADAEREAAAAAAAEAQAEAQEETVQPPPRTVPVEAPSRSIAGPVACFAVAGVGLVTFIASGVVAKGRFDRAEDECNETGFCDIDELDRVDRGALIADIGLGVAAAGAVAGVIWWIVGAKADDTRADIVPTEGGAAVSLRGSF